MKGLQMMLKALGVNITDADIRMLESILPQVPAKISEIVKFVDSWQKNFDQRLQMLEKLYASERQQNANLEAKQQQLLDAFIDLHTEILEAINDGRRTDSNNDSRNTSRKRLN